MAFRINNMKPNLTKIYLAVASFAEGVAPYLEALAKVSRGLASEPQPEAPAVTEPEAPAPKKRGPNKAKTEPEVIAYVADVPGVVANFEPPNKPKAPIEPEFDNSSMRENIAVAAKGFTEIAEMVSAAVAPVSTHDKDSLLALCKPISGGTFDGAAEARKELTQLVKKYGGTISKMDPKHYDAFAAEAEAMIKQHVK